MTNIVAFTTATFQLSPEGIFSPAVIDIALFSIIARAWKPLATLQGVIVLSKDITAK